MIPAEAIKSRLATVDDLPAINAIYNHYVAASTCTYQTEPSTADERLAWFAAHDARCPITVIEEAGAVVGWASLSRFHPREAYRPTVEDSLYVRHDRLGRGLGTLLLGDLLLRAQRLGYHSVIALISAEQAGSIRLHARQGFTAVGRLREVGRKFDQWLDVVYMQKMLTSPGSAMSAR